ncbi:H(+)-transporting V0 sector ATPase subunit a [Polyrhizophydium stewartii]|uniref:V-type proton ATPase subunit a n=1 Tax=Polyrhizophydium stewartii TaxID=2732419 RepID=A0ABR4MVZ0_9FUNG|nr:H(+)-transporting V0 sector ATPase subunit a [Polyrhizophydium stewartii]
MADEESMFRSQRMSLAQLYIPLEIAPQTVAELGEVGKVQFNDLNAKVNAFQRTFVNEIKRLNDMERRIRFLFAQAEKNEIKVANADPLAPYARTRSQVEIDQLDASLTELESKIMQMNNSHETLNKRFLELSELRHVLRETAVFFQEAESRTDVLGPGAHQEDTHLLAAERESLDAGERLRAVSLGFVAGVIPRPRMAVFERILFRALRGNLYLNHAEIDDPITDPATDAVVYKNVFVIFAHGKELINKIRKICESMGATLYPVDEHPDKRRENALEVISRLEDLKHVLDNTKAARHAELSRVAALLDQWSLVVQKEKAIYHAMNMFNYDANRKALIAEGWCPTTSLPQVQQALRTVTERTSSTIPPLLNEIHTSKEPPTCQKTNRFTESFQGIVDAYGVAKYGEVNPGLFTCVTFPFLFAVMFGDFGHGLLVTAFGIWTCAYEKDLAKKKWGEIWDMFFGGRYIILLMGLFSIFTGLIYNDIFSQSMTLFTSRYHFAYHNSTQRWIGEKSSTYGFGLDPAWHGAENSLIFTNSYKMKMAIILGFFHMSFGIFLQIFNHVHFNRRVFIYAEVLPQVLFFWSIFGYLVFIVVLKWLTYYPDPSKAPSLLNALIYMFLSPGYVEMQLFPGQGPLQVFLVLLAFITVPWMLLAKPTLLYLEHKKTIGAGYGQPAAHDAVHINAEAGHTPDSAGATTQAHANDEDEDDHGGHGGHGGAFDFSEIMIHQMIHTIEFCLNGISNTASYLRLWALSLAHAQLSEVLWTMVLVPSLNMANAIAIVIGFFIWFMLTVFILVLMEGMSAFLHALRLHWVEFQNKFYGGTGRQFVPFSFKLLFSENSE